MINMILLPESQNTKTGNILQSYSSPSSCPVSCPFKESGCYAKNIRTAKVWDRADNREDNRFIGCQDDLANALTGAPHRLRESPARSVVFAPETGNP